MWGFAGNVRHQPDRIRRHRRVYPDAGDGVQEWPDYRHQFGGDCFRIISFPAIRRGTMQRVSLAAFVLAMGMLVDNAIVIIDGILVDLKAGKDRMEAMTAIGRQTAMPLLGATLIAIIAFLPIYMSPDTAGVYTRDLFIVLAVSLLLSWVLALLHVPLMANRRLHPAVENDNSGKRVYKGKIYAILRAALRFGLSHRLGFTLTMVALLLLSAYSYRFLRQEILPRYGVRSVVYGIQTSGGQ